MTAPKKAVLLWGIGNQVRKLAEECSELAVAAHHYDRGRPGDLAALFEEVADVEIMIEGIRSFYGDERFDAFRTKKLSRLESRLKEASKDAAKKVEQAAAVNLSSPKKAKRVRIDGKTFPSISQAAEYLGCTTATLSVKLRTGGGKTVYKGTRAELEVAS